ncbi:hypothetical protein F511_22818 [Dorcoceras hygrometricum]|uniref:Uncharacterized protein n=1 Tax=Dorcoceras hygrometricum TaxID=472368 RepID=A0A2Z7AL32_9LAMI|nr:hypothetical protein F511_22818 [Dorcoceras hygrometricum]
MQVLCMRTRLQPKTGSQRISKNCSTTETNQLDNSGHGVSTKSQATQIREPAKQLQLGVTTQPALSYPSNTTEGSKRSTRLQKGDVFAIHLHLLPSFHKLVPNEASQQEESSATTLTSVGAVYRRQSEKIRLQKGDVFAIHLHLLPSFHKLVPNEASQQEESSATTLTSVGAVYRRQSEKIRKSLFLLKLQGARGGACGELLLRPTASVFRRFQASKD